MALITAKLLPVVLSILFAFYHEDQKQGFVITDINNQGKWAPICKYLLDLGVGHLDNCLWANSRDKVGVRLIYCFPEIAVEKMSSFTPWEKTDDWDVYS